MKDRFTIDILSPSYLVGQDKKLTSWGYMSLFQELSYLGSESVGMGEERMTSMGYAWVLIRERFKVLEPVGMNVPIRLETWHRGLQGLYFVREYRIKDMEGSLLAAASGMCVLISLEDRRLRRIDHVENLGDKSPQSTESFFDDFPPKLEIPEGQDSGLALPRTVYSSDVDLVGHLNNINYIKYAADFEALHPDAVNSPSDVTINFIKEAHLGEELSIRRWHSGGVSTHLISHDGAPLMLASFKK